MTKIRRCHHRRKCALWIIVLVGAIQWYFRCGTTHAPNESLLQEGNVDANERSADPLIDEEEERRGNRAHIPSPTTPRPHSSVKVPYPIFVASLYKSGTTSVHEYFKCGGEPTAHKWGPTGHIGLCMRENIENNRPAFFQCGKGENSVFSDNSKECWDPSVTELQAIYKSYPNATIMLGTRDSYHWIDSVDRFRFRNWALLDMLTKCGDDLWPEKSQKVGDRDMTKEDIRQFYLWHIQHVRDFAVAHPSLTFIDFDIESEDAGAFLEESIGITKHCWGNENQNTKHPANGSAAKKGKGKKLR